MGDEYGIVKVAAVQAESVFLDREGSTEKACRLIREAGKAGARIIGFPEGFIPAHPVWYHHHAATGAIANKLAVELFKNSVEIPGPQTDALCAAARDANAYVVIGVCEKIPNTIGTMYNSQLYIGPDGTLIRKHQKIMPTVGERLAGQRIDVPRLQVAAGRRALRLDDQLLDDLGIDRLVVKETARDAAVDGFKNVHV